MSNASKGLPKGTKVTAPDGDGYHLPAVVDASGYRVKWDDGSGAHWLAADKVKFEGEPPPLDKIPLDLKATAEWPDNGEYYGVTVLSGGYSVRWEGDTGNKQWVTPTQLRVREVPVETTGDFEVGEHVVALWTNGGWYGAVVQEFDGEKYKVAWDDGSKPDWRERKHIQKN